MPFLGWCDSIYCIKLFLQKLYILYVDDDNIDNSTINNNEENSRNNANTDTNSNYNSISTRSKADDDATIKMMANT